MDITTKGAVSSIVYYNADNGYTVLQLDTTDGDTVTCVGNLPRLYVGEVLEISAHTGYHQRYGEQLIIDSYRIDSPTTRSSIIKYLSSGLIKGVGEATALNIYNHFGDDTMGVIESNPMKLAEVKGISAKKAMDIAQAIGDLRDMQAQIMFLQQYGITANMALKIFNKYKQRTKSVVSDNPYKLIDDVEGIGFATADKIAISMGHKTDGEFRIRAAIVYTLRDCADKEGHTYLEQQQLLQRCSQLLGLNLQDYAQVTDNVLTKLVLEPVIKQYEIEGVSCVALVKYYALEKGIANSLMRLNHDARRLMLDADSMIQQFEQVHHISFHVSQAQAVRSAIVNGVTVITGGPGTGKTTIIKCIADIFGAHGLRLEFCAPTGRAAKRLSQSTGREAKTIHRLLGVEMLEGKLNFKYGQNNPLPCDVIIADEMSMADVSLAFNLLRAADSGTRVILVGDKDQLPSVGAGNVLADIIASKVVDVRYLTYIYRQSEDSLIVSNAHLINSCKMPVIDNSSKDFFYMSVNEFDAVADTVVQLVERRLPKFTGVPATEIQVLGALKNGVAGVDNLNTRLQQAVNPPTVSKKEMWSGKRLFREGDRVMQTVNEYELTYIRVTPQGTEEGSGVFNGDIGFVKRIDRENGILEVMFDDNRLVQYTAEYLSDLQLAYAITVHKSQGSEFDVVVIPLVNGPPTIINKNLLYTAVTRAKKVVVLVGKKSILGLMIHNNTISTRNTMLRRFLKEEKYRYEQYFDTKDDVDKTN